MYDLYKPFRNYMRTVQTVPSLLAVYALHQHLLHDTPLPDQLQPRDRFGLPIRVKENLFPWDLDVLAREVILNGDPAGKHSLQQWNAVAKAGNFIRGIDDGITRRRTKDYDIFRVMHRIIHFQFPWQLPAPQRDELLGIADEIEALRQEVARGNVRSSEPPAIDDHMEIAPQ